MKRPRTLVSIGVTTAGLLAVAGVAGAAVVQASPPTGGAPSAQLGLNAAAAQAAPVVAAVQSSRAAPAQQGQQGQAGQQSQPAQPGQPGQQARTGATPAVQAARSAEVLARVKAAVQAKYPKVKITKVQPVSNGWTVTVTVRQGVTGTVPVDRRYTVGKLTEQRAPGAPR